MPIPRKELDLIWTADHEERAAVYEFEHGQERQIAEVAALRSMGDQEDADWLLSTIFDRRRYA